MKAALGGVLGGTAFPRHWILFVDGARSLPDGESGGEFDVKLLYDLVVLTVDMGFKVVGKGSTCGRIDGLRDGEIL